MSVLLFLRGLGLVIGLIALAVTRQGLPCSFLIEFPAMTYKIRLLYRFIANVFLPVCLPGRVTCTTRLNCRCSVDNKTTLLLSIFVTRGLFNYSGGTIQSMAYFDALSRRTNSVYLAGRDGQTDFKEYA